jgi:chromosome segregation ATPase
MTTVPPARTSAAIAARRASTELSVLRVRDALDQMRAERTAITVSGVARRAAVSRTFLYENSQTRALLAEAAGQSAAAGRGTAASISQADACWRERALNAEDGLRAAHQEISRQREQIAHLLGQIRDLEHHFPDDHVQRAISENSALKQQVHQLTADRKALDERLKSARDNNRFLDKRIADLEVELLDQNGRTETPEMR